MIRSAWALVAIVCVPLVAYPLISLASGSPRFPSPSECIRSPVEGQPVDVVFGRYDDPVSAAEARDDVVAVGFVGTEALADGCGRWKVVLENVPDRATAEGVQVEAGTVDLHPTLERGTGD